MPRATDTAAKIKELLEEGNLSPAQIASKLNISRQYVYQVIKRDHLKIRAAYFRPYRPRNVPHPQCRIATAVPVPPVSYSSIGTVSELIAAADLIARGWSVFFPLVRSTAIDLLITSKDATRVLRIEVRSGHRRDGQLKFMRKQDSQHDHYAVVLTGEPVIYLPDLPTSGGSNER